MMPPRVNFPAAALLATLLVTACGGSDGPVSMSPGLLAAAEVRATTVALAWVDRSLTETGFRVERSTAGGGYEVAGEVASDVTAFVDSGLEPKTSYRYRVHALLPGGGDVPSLPLTVVTVSPGMQGTNPSTAFVVGGQQITVHGDGFSAGVDRVSFNNIPGRELRVLDDATLVVNAPPSTTVGLASVSLVTPTSTSRTLGDFRFHRWPPDYTPVSEIRTGLSTKPESVQMIGSAGLSHLVWVEDQPRRMLYVARAENGRWGEPAVISPPLSKPWYPHAAVDETDVYIVWLASGSVYLSRSHDGGLSYQKPVKVPAPASTPHFPRVAVSGRHVHVVWSDQRAGKGELYHNVSRDGGRTFAREAFRINEFLGVFDVRIAAAGPHVFVVWWSPVGFGGVKFQRSQDHGGTWPEPDQHLAFKTGGTRASAPQILFDHGRLFVLSHEGGDRRIVIQRSTDRGATWEPRQFLDRSDDLSVSARLAVSPGGEDLCVVWHEKGTATHAPAVELNRSTDGGSLWLRSPLTVTSVPDALDTTPIVCIDGPVVTVAYATQQSGGDSDVFALHSSDGGGRWQGLAWLNRREARSPVLACHGGDVVVTWVGCEPGRKSWSLRTVRSPQ